MQQTKLPLLFPSTLKPSYVACVTAMSEDIVTKQISQEKLINNRNNRG